MEKVKIVTCEVKGKMQFISNTNKVDAKVFRQMIENPTSSGLEFSELEDIKIVNIEEKDASEVFKE